ncbi:MAG: RDD family protein [Lewinellaceae bacterium]|nr:RDD family protein [Lewinellaceae bacterium]
MAQKTIEITTTQNVTIEYELALLRERMLAWLLDLVVFVISYFLLFLLLLRPLLSAVFRDSGFDLGFAFFLLPFLFYFFYNIFFEIWNAGRTPGKMALNIRVVRLDGKDPEWSDVVMRALLHLVDSFFSAGIIGSLLIKTTGKSQRLGDMAANTTVIKLHSARINYRLEDILNIYSLERYQPVYPQVSRLGEHDMIYIKKVLNRWQQFPNTAHNALLGELTARLMDMLDIDQRPASEQEFLKTLLLDYIVLTR